MLGQRNNDRTIEGAVVTAGDKEFKLEAFSNHRGRALRVEESGGRGRILIIPACGVKEFVKALERLTPHLKE